jgi:hypothetical protein
VRLKVEFLHLFLADLDSGLIAAPVRNRFDMQPLFGFEALIMFTTVSKLTSGSPFQFRLMKENIRCSILFHLLAPGGYWPTTMSNPASSLNCCR